MAYLLIIHECELNKIKTIILSRSNILLQNLKKPRKRLSQKLMKVMRTDNDTLIESNRWVISSSWYSCCVCSSDTKQTSAFSNLTTHV